MNSDGLQRRYNRRTVIKAAGILSATAAIGALGLPGLAEATPAGTWTLYAPLSTGGPGVHCASDYTGHGDNALDFGGVGGTAVKVFFNAGPTYGGIATITNANGLPAPRPISAGTSACLST